MHLGIELDDRRASEGSNVPAILDQKKRAAIYLALFGVIAVITASFTVGGTGRKAGLNTNYVPFFGVGVIVFLCIVSTIMKTIAYNSLFGNSLYSA